MGHTMIKVIYDVANESLHSSKLKEVLDVQESLVLYLEFVRLDDPMVCSSWVEWDYQEAPLKNKVVSNPLSDQKIIGVGMYQIS